MEKPRTPSTLGVKELPFEWVKNRHANKNEGSKFVTIDGIDVHYREEGEGPTILFLHGICDSLHTWGPWVEELKKDFHVIRFDLPFFGLSRVLDDKTITKEFYPTFLESLVTHFRLKDFYLCGHSLGAWISWNYAIKNQSLLKKLILISPPGHPVKPPFLVRATGNGFIKKLASLYTPKFLADMAIEEIFYDPSFMTEVQRSRYYEILMVEGNRKNYMNVFSMMVKFAHEWPEGLHTIETETLIIWGKEDRWIPSSHASYWTKTLPHVHLEVFDRVGHVPQEENVQDTLKSFKQFLK
ncbi:MAG: alpha/beta hydrolase [Deltaproteobacteria bacterium]|nr:MAG: alpha/beta hydrolase [Deltaproteobacteria bacterium]